MLFSIVGIAVGQNDAPPREKAAAPDKAAPRKITTVAGITQYALDNGLTVLIFPDESRATVTVNITYLVGSRHEGYGEGGMAHLLEHLMFKGTPDHAQVWKTLQFSEELLAKLNALTPQDVQAAVKKHIPMDKLIIIRAGDFAKHAAPANAKQTGD